MPRRNVGEFHMLTWMGKAQNHIRVGKDKSYDHQTIQAAIDSITDAAEDNPYAITVDVGVYERAVINKSYINLIAVRPGSVVVSYAGNTGTRGTLQVRADGEKLTDIGIDGFTLVNTGISNPDPALAIGRNPELYTDWDRIIVKNCTLVGNQDAVRIWGNETSIDGHMILQNNAIYCGGNAVGITAHGIIESIGNVIYVDSSLSTIPFMDGIASDEAARVTGIHVNPRQMPGNEANETDMFKSTGDSITIIADRIMTGSESNNGNCAAICFYHTLGGNLTASNCQIVNPNITVDWVHDSDSPGFVCGIKQAGALRTFADHGLIVSGGIISVRNTNTGASAPDNVHGVYINNTDTEDFVARIYGTAIYVQNDKGGGNAYSLRTGTDANSKIRHHAFSDAPIESGAANTITALTPLGGDAIE